MICLRLGSLRPDKLLWLRVHMLSGKPLNRYLVLSQAYPGAVGSGQRRCLEGSLPYRPDEAAGPLYQFRSGFNDTGEKIKIDCALWACLDSY